MTIIWIILGMILGICAYIGGKKYRSSMKSWLWYEWLVVAACIFLVIFGAAWIITNIAVIKSSRGAGVGGIFALIIPVLCSGYIRRLLTKGGKRREMETIS